MHVLHLNDLPIRNLSLDLIKHDKENNIFKIYMHLSVDDTVFFNSPIIVDQALIEDTKIKQIRPPDKDMIADLVKTKDLEPEQINNLITSKIINWFFFPIEHIDLVKEFYVDEDFQNFISRNDNIIRHYLGMVYIKHFFPETDFIIIGGHADGKVNKPPISFSNTVLKGFNQLDDPDYFLQHDLFYKTPKHITLN